MKKFLNFRLGGTENPRSLSAILKSRFHNKSIYLVVLILFSIISHRQWFNFFSVLNSGDWLYWPNESTGELLFSWGTWLSFWNFGVTNIQVPFLLFTTIWALIVKIGLSYDVAVKITFLMPIAIFGFLSPYIFVKKLVRDNFVAFLVALFYGTSVYFLVRQTAHLPMAFIYSLAPLIFYAFMISLEKNSANNWITFILFSFLGVCYEVRLMYIVFFILFLYFFFFYLKNFKQFISKAFLPLFIFFLLNLFWLLPMVFGGSFASVQSVANRGLFGSFLFTLSHALTIFDSSWTGGYPNHDFIRQPVMVYFWLIPLMAFSAILFRNLRHKKEVIFFSTLSLIGIFLTKQADEPLPGFYLWLYENFPGFNLFREASKFYLVTAIGYSGLLAYALIFLKENKKRFLYKFLLVGFSCIILFISFSNTKPLLTEEIKTMFVSKSMPSDYLVLQEFILKQPEYFRTFWMPKDSRWGIFTNKHPKISAIDMMQKDWTSYVGDSKVAIQEQLSGLLARSFSEALLNISAVRYVVVPIQDIANNDDFFENYGGVGNKDIRNFYLGELNKIRFLQKIDIGTKDLAVYENKGYKPYFYAVDSLLNFHSLSNIEEKYDFIADVFGGNFNFTNTAENRPYLADAEAVFDDIKSESISANNDIISKIGLDQNKESKLYIDSGNQNLFYVFKNGELTFFAKRVGEMMIDGQLRSVVDKEDVIYKKVIGDGNNYYLNLGNLLMPLSADREIDLGNINRIDFVKLVSLDNVNHIFNPSFEGGLWQDEVSDCNNYDKNPILKMGLDENNKSDGIASLRLEATRHIACTNSSQNMVMGGKEYLFSFDYQSNNAKTAGYYLSFNDEDNSSIQERVPVRGGGWNNYSKIIKVPDLANTLRVVLYSYSSDDQNSNENIITNYDNFYLYEIKEAEKINIVSRASFVAENFTSSGTSTFTYKNNEYGYANLINNGSLESGLWQEKVGDCNNYDNNAVIGMNIIQDEKSDGDNALELSSVRHFACAGQAYINVKENTNYLFGFDYQSSNAKEAGYYIGFNDDKKTAISERLKLNNSEWHHFDKMIRVPLGATHLSFSVYAYEKDQVVKVVNRYDNFKLIELPSIQSSYYVVNSPREKLVNPRQVKFELLNPTKKKVHVSAALKPFFLVMSEGYHDNWKLMIDNEKVSGKFNSWWPYAKSDMVSNDDHFKYNDFLNVWYVDTSDLCVVKKLCRENSDGTYDIEMAVEFWPQRWFYFGLLISSLALSVSLGYFAYHKFVVKEF